MRDADNIREVTQLGVDWIGFVFWADSPRFVRQISSRAGIIPDYSSLEHVDFNEKSTKQQVSKVKKVGVFVDDMPQNIVTRVVNYHLDIIQLQGSESRIMVDNLRRTLDPDIRPGIQIMKSLTLQCADDLEKCKEYEGSVDYFLFDIRTKNQNVEDSTTDWSIVDSYKGNIPFILSGDIGPNDVELVKSFRHPLLAGIELNSCFESEPAMKDVELIRKFIVNLRG